MFNLDAHVEGRRRLSRVVGRPPHVAPGGVGGQVVSSSRGCGGGLGVRPVERVLGPEDAERLLFDAAGLPCCLRSGDTSNDDGRVGGGGGGGGSDGSSSAGAGSLRGASELRAELLALCGADRLKATAGWVANHFKWVCWKLAATERGFPAEYGGRLLTWRRVREQVRGRYEREVVRKQRSPVWSLAAGDAPADRALVLCVHRVDLNAKKLGLTDGW